MLLILITAFYECMASMSCRLMRKANFLSTSPYRKSSPSPALCRRRKSRNCGMNIKQRIRKMLWSPRNRVSSSYRLIAAGWLGPIQSDVCNVTSIIFSIFDSVSCLCTPLLHKNCARRLLHGSEASGFFCFFWLMTTFLYLKVIFRVSYWVWSLLGFRKLALVLLPAKGEASAFVFLLFFDDWKIEENCHSEGRLLLA